MIIEHIINQEKSLIRYNQSQRSVCKEYDQTTELTYRYIL